MRGAAEIAKLRLFVKLAAEAKDDSEAANRGLEPLPDIDFNIRAGNSLVGFASMAEFEAVAGGALVERRLMNAIIEDAKHARMASDAFRQAQNYQATGGEAGEDYRRSKSELATRLDALNQNMHRYLAKQYGVDDADPAEYALWMQTHRPFHWLAEFYGIIEEAGGFDVVIGNPPYVAVKKLNYRLASGGDAFRCPDIYGHMTKKALELTAPKGQVGFIVMHSLAFSRDFADMRKVMADKAGSAWFSAYGRIPSGLFSSDVRVRNCIMLASKDSRKNQTHTTRLHRWNASHRQLLFPLLHYTPAQVDGVIPMFNDSVQAELFGNWKFPSLVAPKKSGCVLQFKKTAYNFISVSPDEPPCFDSQGEAIAQTNIQQVFFKDESPRDLAMLFFGGRIFFSCWLIYGNDFSVTRNNLMSLGLPVQNLSKRDQQKLALLAGEFKSGLQKTLQFKLNAGMRVGSYNTSKLWRITDQSDMIFLRHITDAPKLAFESVILHTTQTIKTGDAR